MINTDSQKIEKVITRGVEHIFPDENFLRLRLSSGERLTVYLGIDPTGSTLHMGHLIPLIKLAQLQELGHRIILLIGNFTAQIGDPDKSETRKPLTNNEVFENAKHYKNQAKLFLNFEGDNPAELKYNGEWLNKMNFADVLKLASSMTVQRMLNRDMFRRRINTQTPIYIHEFMYPLMQGYDSVVMNVDGEVGGNDQTFNMLVGRDLLKKETPPKEKFVIPMKLLVDKNGEKMGKTTGNMLSFMDSADEKFKKIMSWSDDMILLGFELLTDVDLEGIQSRLTSGENPRDIKFDLAYTLVSRFHGDTETQKSKETWVREVGQDQKPKDIPTISLKESFLKTLTDGTGESKSQIKRLVKERAIRINDEKISDEYYSLARGDIIQIGKKRWFEVSKNP